MTTGEGGMLTTSDPSLAGEFRLARSHGEESRYRHVRLGFNFRLTDFAAALGREQGSQRSGGGVLLLRGVFSAARGLAGLVGLETPRIALGAGHAFNLFTICLNPELLRMSRDEFQTALAKRGIETAVHYPLPLHRQPLFRGRGSDRDFPVSTRLAETVLSLPVHPGLSHWDLRYIVRSVREVAGSAARA
jgi:perosamine synthetase